MAETRGGNNSRLLGCNPSENVQGFKRPVSVVVGRRQDMENFKDKPDLKRLEALRNLPREVTRTLTKQEVKAFLEDDEWPDSLKKKLKDYLVDDN